MGSRAPTALVTGGNKGLGLAIVRGLARRDPIMVTLLGSRDRDRGLQSLELLKSEGLDNVRLIEIDVDNQQSIKNAASLIEKEYGALEILVNNAGIASPGKDLNVEIARRTINTNYYGVLNVSTAFLPLVRKASGCIVNIASTMGSRALAFMAETRQKQFLDPALTVDELSKLMEEFIVDVSNGDYQERGWPANSYGVSKAGVQMLTRVMARDNPDLVINCCCPGWVKTDMTGPHATLTPDEGAVTPLKLCRLGPGAPSGQFWFNSQPTDWIAHGQ